MIIYDRVDVVFQEIPNEVSLAFTLKGCPNMCKGCHSPHLREDHGEELTLKKFENYLNKYKGSITTVLFLGGDAFQKELIPLMKATREYGFKTAIYSGLDIRNIALYPYVDYYKVGRYIESKGGLDNRNTNQRLYKLSDSMEDITYKFWK